MKDDVKINIIVSQQGVERVQILGGIANQKSGMRLYDFIAKNVKSLDRSLKENYASKSVRQNCNQEQ